MSEVENKTKWNKEVWDFGEVKQGTILTGSFELLDDSVIENVRPACGCTNVSHSSDNNKAFSFTYKAEKLPVHLLAQGYFEISKRIEVTVNNPVMKYKQFTNLYIRAKIIK